MLLAEPYPDLWFLDVIAYGMFAAIAAGAFVTSVVILRTMCTDRNRPNTVEPIPGEAVSRRTGTAICTVILQLSVFVVIDLTLFVVMSGSEAGRGDRILTHTFVHLSTLLVGFVISSSITAWIHQKPLGRAFLITLAALAPLGLPAALLLLVTFPP